MSHLFRRKEPFFCAFRWPVAVCFLFFIFSSLLSAEPTKEFADEALLYSKCWEYNAPADLDVNAVADASNVYFLDNENKLHGVDLTFGKKVWSTDVGGDVVSNLLIADDSVFVVTSSTATPGVQGRSVLWSISRQTGITEWHAEVSRSPSSWLGKVGGNVLAVGSEGVVSAFGAAKGEPLWTIKIGSNVTSEPYFDSAGLALGIEKNEVVRISGLDGRLKVVWKSEHLPTAVLLDARGRLLVGDERGNLVSVSPTGSPSWRFRNGARISRVLAFGTEYIAASNDNFVYDISRGGDVRWKRRLPGRVAGAPLVLGDTVIVSTLGAGAVYLLDSKNGKIRNRIETGDDASPAATGRPDGQGFVMTSSRGIVYYSRAKCPVK